MKLERVRLRNVLSHKDADIELSPILTIFEGDSNHGKSNIMRGLSYNMLNEPAGEDLLKNDSPRGTNAEVILSGTRSDGEPFEISRIRGKSVNKYVIDGGDNLVVGQGQPEEVDRLLNLSPNAIHRQQDGYFLLGPNITDGQVARVLGTAFGLTEMDNMFAYIRKLKSANDAAIRTSEKIIENESVQLEKYEELDSCACLVEQLAILHDEYIALLKTIEDISACAQEYELLKPDLLTDILTLELEFNKLDKLMAQNEKDNAILHEIEDVLAKLSEIKDIVDDFIMDEINDSLKIAQEHADEYMSGKSEIQEISVFLEEYDGIVTVDTAELTAVLCGIDDITNMSNELSQIDCDIDDISLHILSSEKTNEEINKSESELNTIQSKYDEFLTNNPVCPECGAEQEYWSINK